MAKADYILCDRCDAKIVYDGEGKIAEGIVALGLEKAPVLCEACRAAAPDATDIVDRLQAWSEAWAASTISLRKQRADEAFREAAEEIGLLRTQYEHLDGLWRKLVEVAKEAGHVNGEGNDFSYLLMSLRMGPPDRYRTALDRIRAAAEYAIEVLEGGGKAKDAVAALRNGMGASNG